jgi:hypothetical protein
MGIDRIPVKDELLVTFTSVAFSGAVPPVPVSETDVDPGTKPIPMTVTDTLDPGTPEFGDIDVTDSVADIP